MKGSRIYLLLLLLVSSIAFADCKNPIGIQTLIKEKSSLSGKSICAVGMLQIEFEGTQLYTPSKTPRISERQAVWLEFFEGPNYTKKSVARDTSRMNAWRDSLQGKCTFVEGTFNAEQTGHFGMWPAGIEHIRSIRAAPKSLCSNLSP